MPSSLTSFDEMLKASYLHAPSVSPIAPVEPPTTAQPTPQQGTEQRRGVFEGRDVPPAGWLNDTSDGQCIEHPLWSEAVTWGGRVAYRPFQATLLGATTAQSLELCKALGPVVTALLPKGYCECDAILRESEAANASGEALSDGEAIYARFTGEITEPSEVDVDRYYARWASLDGLPEPPGVDRPTG